MKVTHSILFVSIQVFIYSQCVSKVVHAIGYVVGISQLTNERHTWPGVLQHTKQITMVHVLLNQQQWVIPAIKREFTINVI